MYAKLFSRITESSLMEEPINVRYTFVLLLAIADSEGYVIGTDVAIARRLNMPIGEFQQCAEALMTPDPDSNSKDEEGRRMIPSDGERGYKLVNYKSYRDLKSEEDRRAYMRDYMRKRRSKDSDPKGDVIRVNSCKQPLAQLGHAEAESDTEAEREKSSLAESPSEKEFIAHCNTLSVPEWYARDKFLAQDAKGWHQFRKWRAYATRVKGWYEQDGRPKQGKNGNGAHSEPFERR